jgi:hypothetical protein
MHSRNSLVIAGCLAAAAMFAGPAAHANPVANSGFETGDFSGWTTFGDQTFSSVNMVFPHTGAFAASFGPYQTTGGISQLVTTVAGEYYAVEFWLKNESDVQNQITSSLFEFSWDGATQMTLTDAPEFDYTRYAFNLLASGSSTELKFTFRQDAAFWDLDDVQVPEPGSLALAGLAIGLAAMQGRRRRNLAPTA